MTPYSRSKQKLEAEGYLVVPLTKGKQAKIDRNMEWLLTGNKWVASKNGNNFYAVRNENYKKVYMHRLVCRPDDGELVDHINGDSLDNRRKNLRICTRQQNAFNIKGRSNQGMKGVTYSSGRWKAKVSLNGKTIHLGSFGNSKAASLAYDIAALNLFGEFARVNSNG